MNVLGILLFCGLMVFAIFQIKGLVLTIKERKKAQQKHVPNVDIVHSEDKKD